MPDDEDDHHCDEAELELKGGVAPTAGAVGERRAGPLALFAWAARRLTMTATATTSSS